MKYIIDRFVESMAVCEDEHKQSVTIPKYKLPLEAKEGDYLIEENGFLKIDTGETATRKEKLKKKMKDLFEQ